MESNASELFDKPLPCPPLTSVFVRLPASNNQHNSFIATILLINFLMAISITLTNFVIVFTILKTRHLQKPSNILILNLAATDIFVGVVVEPSTCISKYAELTRNSQLLCQSGLVVAHAIWILSLMSLISLTAITVDRYLAIHLHLRYQELITTRRYAMLHILLWLLILMIGLARIFHNNYQLFIPLAGILYSSLSLTNLYFILKINRVIKRHSVQIHAQLTSSTLHIINMPKIKKSVVVMLITLGAFLICYLPYFGLVITFIITAEKSSLAKGYAANIVITLVKVNSLVNPIIYWWRIKELRNAAVQLFRKLWS